MSQSITTLGLQSSVNSNLAGGQKLLSQLTEQLTTGVYSSNLSDYTASDAQKLLNVSSVLAEQQGFLDVIGTLDVRLKMYDSTLTGVEDTISEAYSSIISQPTYEVNSAGALQNQIAGYLDQMSYYLNQRVGDRYIYSGARYSMEPVGDLSALPVPPTETPPYLATGDTLPSYDAQYDSLDPLATMPAAYVKNSTAIDSSSTITYGINSNETGFQQVIMGLRWAYAATQDPDNYSSYMQTANTLLTDGTANIRATHTGATNAYNRLQSAATLISGNILSLKTQADDIAKIDLNEVSIKITLLKTQLEASYSATAILLKLSLSDYI